MHVAPVGGTAVQDHVALAEIELCGDLIIAASAAHEERLSLESIEDAIGSALVQGHSAANPKAPGQLNSHYAPRKRLVLGTFPQLFKTYGQVQVGTLSFRTLFQGVEKRNQIVLSPSGNLEEAARNLFSGLRELDKMEVSVILAEEVPDIGIGKAINDRLHRAATYPSDRADFR